MISDTEKLLAQMATCSNELRVLVGMLGDDNSIATFAEEVASFLDGKRERWGQ